MNIIVIGLNHKTAPLGVREKLAFDKQELPDALALLKRLSCVSEAVLVSTCNRVEIYASVKDGRDVTEEIIGFISEFHKLPAAEFREMLYVYRDTEAVRHVLRVASSLDSMIPGEPQILGQVKDSFEAAASLKTSGFLLNRLMKKAISAAKRVRSETRIAENAVSISYAAVELAKKIFGSLAGKSVMLLGAGEMAELAARHLMNAGVGSIMVANRTHERGCEIAAGICGKAVRFEDINNELVNTDILICSTNAPSYIVSAETMFRTMKERRFRPVFVIDISVPRNVDPAANNIDNVYLYNIDDLQQAVGSNIKERMKEAARAEEIVTEEVEKFVRGLSALESAPVVVALRQKAEEIKSEELARFRKRVSGLDDETMAAVERLAGSITNKLLHEPSVALKEIAENREFMVYLAKKLYGLDENEDE
jgi:glutamyl-tRNA reductase